MIFLKKKSEIENMKKGGKVLAEVLGELIKNVKPGVSEIEIDELAEKLIVEKGAEPGFKKVPGYKNSICVSTNNVVVHGIPTNYKFKKGDVVGIDCGVFYKGFHTDMAETTIVSRGPVASFPPASAPASLASQRTQMRAVRVPSTDATPQSDIPRFIETGKKALFEGIKQAKVGNRVGHISKTIQEIVEGAGYSVVRSLVGHGVGRKLHEEPEVPGFLVEPIGKTPKLLEAMTIAIEVIYNMGGSEVIYSNSDDWTISTADASISGLFERTILISNRGPVILTQ